MSTIITHRQFPHYHKYTMDLAGRPLRSLKPVGVIQELYALLIAHYVIRALMHQAALHQQLDPDRLSFVHALEVVRDAIAEFQMTARHLLVELLQRLWRDLVRYLLPKRRNRTNPRVVKRKMSKYFYIRQEQQDSAGIRGSYKGGAAD